MQLNTELLRQILDKLDKMDGNKSFGMDVVANVLGNIITRQ